MTNLVKIKTNQQTNMVNATLRGKSVVSFIAIVFVYMYMYIYI